MLKRILFIGGEQHGVYNMVRETKKKVEIYIYPKIDIKKLSGIVTVSAQPIQKFIIEKDFAM